MARKKDIRKCRYQNCHRALKEIDTASEDYVLIGSMYFHKDCYEAKLKQEAEEKQRKADLQLIRNLWIENINDTVVYSVLFMELNRLLQRGISSDYLVYVMRYVVDHKLKLRYPAGFKYYVDNKKIKDSYARSKVRESKEKQSFVVADEEAESPKFSVQTKRTGFQSILEGKQ